MSMNMIDIGDICTHCGNDTSMGSGRFVNRIPSQATWYIESYEFSIDVDGWMCDECHSPIYDDNTIVEEQ